MKPTAADSRSTPLVLYREYLPGSGDLVLDERVRVLRVSHGVGADSDADIELMWQAVGNATGPPIRNELFDSVIADRYGPGVRCAVGTVPQPNAGFDVIEFVAHGYLDAPEIKFGADGTRSFFKRTFKLRDIFQRSARQEGSQVQGRWMLSKWASEALDKDAQYEPGIMIDLPWPQVASQVQALPAIFNFQGRPNKTKSPVLFNSPDGWTTGPTYLFTYDGDPDAEHWTFLQALRYLILLHLPYGLDAHVGPGDLFTTLAGPGGGSFPWWSLKESDMGAAARRNTQFRDQMIRNCQSLAVEGFDLREALLMLGAQSGMRFHVDHSNESQGSIRVLSDLKFWFPADSEPRSLAIEHYATQFSGSGSLRPIGDILDNNNVTNATLQRDFSRSYSRVEVIGQRKWRTVRTELVPLWKPHSFWDDVSTVDADTYKADAYDSGSPFSSLIDSNFYGRHHVRGLNFRVGDNNIAGRYWGIDPAGELDPDDYNREGGLWTKYDKPWTFKHVQRQVRRRRVMRAIPGQDIDDHEALGVVLEISFDGTVWYRLITKFRVYGNRTAIYLADQDLLAIGSDTIRIWGITTIDNFYDAYLKDLIQLRATFQIELDECVVGTAVSPTSPLAPHRITKTIVRRRDFKLHGIDSSVDRDIAAGIEEIDDRDTIKAFAEHTLTKLSPAKWKGNPIIPWIETAFVPLGTPIEGIRRLANGPVDIRFGGNSARDELFPVVIKKIYLPAEQTTQLVLEDYALRPSLGPTT